MKAFIVFAGLVLATTLAGQTLDKSAIQKQQRSLSDKIILLRTNWLTFWMDAYPNGAPFATRDKESERKGARSPKINLPKGAFAINSGLGCVSFIVPVDLPPIPENCAPVDVQAHLGMEALREDWENGRSVPEGNGEAFAILHVLRNQIPELWSQEKTLYCVLRPDAQYIDLNDSIQD
jgi:hypothetical protein